MFRLLLTRNESLSTELLVVQLLESIFDVFDFLLSRCRGEGRTDGCDGGSGADGAVAIGGALGSDLLSGRGHGQLLYRDDGWGEEERRGENGMGWESRAR